MDKQKKQLIIVGILIIIFIIMLLNSFKKKPAARGADKPVSVTAVPPKPAGGPVADSLPIRPDEKKINTQLERAKLPWGRNPFAASSEKEYWVGELQLKGISFDAKTGGFAYINEEIVKRGDAIAGYEVIEIERDKVLLKKGNQSFYLVFPGQE